MAYTGYSIKQKKIDDDITEYLTKLQKTYVVKEGLSAQDPVATAIAADGVAPSISQDGYWEFVKENNEGVNANKKINWYFYGDIDGSKDLHFGDLEAFYVKMWVSAQSDDPWLTAYTRVKGDGSDASWYNSRWNMTGKIGQLPKDQWVDVWFSREDKQLDEVFPHLLQDTKVELQLSDMEIAGNGDENVATYLIALSSNSTSSNMNVKVAEVGYKFAGRMPQIVETH